LTTPDSTFGLSQIPIAVKLPEAKLNGPRDFVSETANVVNLDGTRNYRHDFWLKSLVTSHVLARKGRSRRQLKMISLTYKAFIEQIFATVLHHPLAQGASMQSAKISFHQEASIRRKLFET